MKIFFYVLFGVVGFFVLINLITAVILTLQKPKPEGEKNYDQKMNADPEALTWVYLHLSGLGHAPEGVTVDEAYINHSVYVTCSFINQRYDCSDFRMQLMFRLYKDCRDMLPKESKELIRKTILDFKYFMDEPGDDSMCYWSENHQVLFAAAEVLAGQEFPDEVFTNSGLTGREHVAKGLARIQAWETYRFRYGFSEFMSNVYLLEDIAAMSNYIEYSHDAPTVQGMKIIMDLLWFDVALHTVNNRFCPVSTRMYAGNKIGNTFGNSIGACMNLLWGEESLNAALADSSVCEEEVLQMRAWLTLPQNKMSVNFYAMYKRGFYALPEVIKRTALSRDTQIIKMSSGLSPEDMQKEGLIGQTPEQIMAQLGSETFTNPEVISNTLRYFRTNRMFRNKGIHFFKYFDLPFMRLIGPERLARKCNLMTHGIALDRGNVYTYRTGDSIMSTVMRFGTDRCGAQEHVWGVNIAPHLALFTTHPARDDGVFGSSPGYWIGNGRRPMSVQHKNVNITIYRIPSRKRLLEFKLARMTHIYMPRQFYDRVMLEGNRVFAQKNNVLVAVTASGKLQYRPFDPKSTAPFGNERHKGQDGLRLTEEFDLCLYAGEYHAYITEISSTAQETFEDFRQRILNADVRFSDGSVRYTSRGTELFATYEGEYTLNGKAEETRFSRYDCALCKAERKDETIVIEGFGERLTLDLPTGKSADCKEGGTYEKSSEHH